MTGMKTTKSTLISVPGMGGSMFKVPQILKGRMRRILLTMGVGLTLFGAATLSQAADPALVPLQGDVPLHGSVPAAVSRLKAKGLVPPTNHLRLAIGLPLRNREALTNLLREIYDPASPNFRHYLTPEEFTARFGPTPQDYQAVMDFASGNGLSVVGTHGNRMLVDVSGNVADVEKAFHVTLRTYQHPKEAREFFAPDTEPLVKGSLPVLHVSGLEDYALPRPLLHKMPVSSATPATGSSPGGGYMGADFRNAYVPGSALNGSGQMVGLLQFYSGFYQSDITAYETLNGLPSVPVQAVLLNGYGGGPGIANDEVSLDIEMVISMAPGVSKVLVFEGLVTDDILNAMASSNQVKQLSASWSYGIDSTTEQIFQQFAAQGQSFFNASGDSDAWVGPIPTPCDDPYITIVGGTTLTTGTGGAWASETVWNWGYGIGTGGGISTSYQIPSWQASVSMATNQGSTTMRNIPDVALTADNVYVLYGGGQQGLFGGTSCASPLWAGFMALVNQQALANSKPTMGFINPSIYTLAAGTGYASAFHDITTGDNTWPGSPNKFYAVTGYDLCTGWGTPGTNLINALVGVAATHISAPSSPYGSTLGALNGGNPNGNWELFVQDDSALNSGIISNGWILTLTSANPVGLVGDLYLSMTNSATNSASSILVSNYLVYYLSVTNVGPSISSNVLVTDFLPAGVTVVTNNHTLGSVVLNGSTLVWNLGASLNVGAGAQLTLTVQPYAVATIVNQAIVSSTSTPDPNPDDDYAFNTVYVNSPVPPQFGSVGVHNGKFVLSITAPAAPTIVQTSTNLASTNWVNVFTSTPPFSYTNNATNPALFYRAKLAP